MDDIYPGIFVDSDCGKLFIWMIVDYQLFYLLDIYYELCISCRHLPVSHLYGTIPGNHHAINIVQYNRLPPSQWFLSSIYNEPKICSDDAGVIAYLSEI